MSTTRMVKTITDKIQKCVDVIKTADRMKWFEFDTGFIKFQVGEDNPSKLSIINKISIVLIWSSLIITLMVFNIDIGMLDIKIRYLIIFIMLLLLLGTCHIKDI